MASEHWTPWVSHRSGRASVQADEIPGHRYIWRHRRDMLSPYNRSQYRAACTCKWSGPTHSSPRLARLDYDKHLAAVDNQTHLNLEGDK